MSELSEEKLERIRAKAAVARAKRKAAEAAAGVDDSTPGDFEGILSSLGEGAFFGWGDEMVAGLGGANAMQNATIRPEELPQLMDSVRAENQTRRRAYALENPNKALVSELVGGGMTGFGLAQGVTKAGAAPFAMSNIGRMSAAGAPAGATYAAGAAEPGERLAAIPGGAAMGAIATPAIGAPLQWAAPALGNVITSAWRAARGGAPDQAENILIHALENSGYSPQEVRRALDEWAPDGTLADVYESVLMKARAAYGRAGQGGRQDARDFLTERQRAQGSRIEAQAGVALDAQAGGYKSYVTKLGADKKAQAAPLYEKAYNAGVDASDPRLTRILEKPLVRPVLEPARDLMQSELGKIGTGVQRLDYIQRALYDKARAAGRGTNEHRILMDSRQEIIDFLEEKVPEWGAARKIWRNGSSAEDAADFGRQLMRGTKYDIDVEDRINGFDSSELEAFRIGVLRSVVDTVKNVTEGTNAAARLAEKPRVRELIEMSLPDEQSIDDFVGFLRRESRMTETYNRIARGSATAERVAEDRALANTTGALASTARELSRGEVTGTVVRAVRTMFNTPEMTDDVAEEIIRVVFSGDRGRRVIDKWARGPSQRNVGDVERYLPGGLGLGSQPQAQDAGSLLRD